MKLGDILRAYSSLNERFPFKEATLGSKRMTEFQQVHDKFDELSVVNSLVNVILSEALTQSRASPIRRLETKLKFVADKTNSLVDDISTIILKEHKFLGVSTTFGETTKLFSQDTLKTTETTTVTFILTW